MKPQLKPIDQQVMVITGASSGIGLATALLAAERGAKLVLAARSAQTLESIAQKINAGGGEAVAVECDVADRAQTERVAGVAIEHFGRIDTWINNAGSAIYGRLDEITDDDNRRLFETNFWGVCNGSLSALPHLKRNGGALINVGSEVSETVMPLLGMYSASKHAVKGFTDALRIEIEQLDDAPVSITLIQPTSVNTPFPQHARNYMDEEPALPQPTIDPRKVAEAILKAATTPTRADKVGTMSVVNTMMGKLMPGIGAKIAAARVDEVKADRAPRNPLGALHQPSERAGPAGHTHGVN
jgi:short-subunit dehydrogenase